MEELVEEFQNFEANDQIQMDNPYFNEIINDFSFFLITKDHSQLKEIMKIIALFEIENEIIVIDEYKTSGDKYLVICFDKTVIIICESEFETMVQFFYQHKNCMIYILKEEIRDILYNTINQSKEEKIILQISTSNVNFKQEIDTFLYYFQIENKHINGIWKIVRSSIAGCLIKKSYLRTFKNRIKKSSKLIKHKVKRIEFTNRNHFVLKTLKSINKTIIQQIYHIEKEKLYIKKILLDEERTKLIKREYDNYSKIHHPFLPRCFRLIKSESEESLIIEYIEGTTLENIQNLKLEYNKKIKIIIEIMTILDYLHSKHYIYRDLKPNNLIIDKIGIPVLIDFDRMIEEGIEIHEKEEERTVIFHPYASPEISECLPFSYSTDIYSLGMMIYYIIFEEDPPFDNIEEYFDNKMTKYPKRKEYLIIKNIINKYTKKNPIDRPNIKELLNYFYKEIFSNININKQIFEINTIENIKNEYTDCYFLYWLYIIECHDPYSLYKLGNIYQKSNLIEPNINKSIHYYLLSSNLNFNKSIIKLGLLYSDRNCALFDINKSIHYYTLATNQNEPNAQFNLGTIYLKGELIPRDINKSIYYYTLAANQNHSKAQFNLGIIYEEGELIPRDINKSIYYYTLSANNNQKISQYFLGIFYFYGVNVQKNLNKGVDYFYQSSKNGYIDSYFALGFVYHIGIYLEEDIEKAVHYYKEASSFNHQYAKNNLGIIYKYRKGETIERRICFSIEYFEEGIRQKNDYICMYNLGHLYFYEQPIKNSIEKSIQLFLKSVISNTNFKPSQYMLCLSSIKQFGTNIDHIIEELNKYQEISDEISNLILDIINSEDLFNLSNFNSYYNIYYDIEYIYDILQNPIEIKEALKLSTRKNKKEIDPRKKDINSNFYEGIGIDILKHFDNFHPI